MYSEETTVEILNKLHKTKKVSTVVGHCDYL